MTGARPSGQPAGHEPSRSTASRPSGDHQAQFGYARLHKKADGWLFIDSEGRAFFLDWWWHQGAQIAFACATVKAALAYGLWRLVGHGKPNSLRWALLPTVGDWMFRDNDGRLSSLARFIECELIRRRALAAATGTAKTPQAVECEASQSGGEAVTPKGGQ